MNILYITYALDGLLLIAMPIVLGFVVTRKYELYWRLWWIGTAIYVLAQIILLPFDNYVVSQLLGKINNNPTLSAVTVLIISALIVGVAVALVEEALRYAMFRWWAKEARAWADGLLAGIGHGGAAAIFLGAIVLYNFLNMVYARSVDISKFVTADQLPLVQAQVNAYWSTPWYTTLAEIVQQVFIFPVQICLALVMLQAFLRKQWVWAFVAFGYHALFETTRVVAQNLLSGYWVVPVLAAFGIGSVFLIFALRRTDSRDLSTVPGNG
jgi:uncharacterized membrane protein YhfC